VGLDDGEGVGLTPMKEIELNKKKPSKDLIKMIENLGQECRDLRKSMAKITKRGHEEGFSDFEIVLLAREVLRPILTRRQLNYWFAIKKSWKKMLEESTGLSLPGVQNDNKNDLGQSSIPLAAQTSMGETGLLNTKNESEQKKSIESKAIYIPTTESNSERTKPRVVSYFDLVDPRSTPLPWREPQDTNFFCISKDCNFGKEYFKSEIGVVDAIEYLRQFVGKFQKIDLGFRVVE
jgi:hypothetical protein